MSLRGCAFAFALSLGLPTTLAFATSEAPASPCETRLGLPAPKTIHEREAELTLTHRQKIEALLKEIFRRAGGDPDKVDWRFEANPQNYSGRILTSSWIGNDAKRPEFEYGRGFFTGRIAPAGFSDDLIAFILMNDYFHEVAANHIRDDIIKSSGNTAGANLKTKVIGVVANEGVEYFADRRALEQLLSHNFSAQGAIDLLKFMNDAKDDGRLGSESSWNRPAARDRLAFVQASLRELTKDASIYPHGAQGRLLQYEISTALKKELVALDATLESLYHGKEYAELFEAEYLAYFQRIAIERAAKIRPRSFGEDLYHYHREAPAESPPEPRSRALRLRYGAERLAQEKEKLETIFTQNLVSQTEGRIRDASTPLATRIKETQELRFYAKNWRTSSKAWQVEMAQRLDVFVEDMQRQIEESTLDQLASADEQDPELIGLLCPQPGSTTDVRDSYQSFILKLPEFIAKQPLADRGRMVAKILHSPVSDEILLKLVKAFPMLVLQQSANLRVKNKEGFYNGDLLEAFCEAIVASDITSLSFQSSADLFSLLSLSNKNRPSPKAEPALQRLAESLLSKFNPESTAEISELVTFFTTKSFNTKLNLEKLQNALTSLLKRIANKDAFLHHAYARLKEDGEAIEVFKESERYRAEILCAEAILRTIFDHSADFEKSGILASAYQLLKPVYANYTDTFLGWDDATFARTIADRIAKLLHYYQNIDFATPDAARDVLSAASASFCVPKILSAIRGTEHPDRQHTTDIHKATLLLAVAFDAEVDPRLKARLKQLAPQVLNALFSGSVLPRMPLHPWLQSFAQLAIPDESLRKSIALNLPDGSYVSTFMRVFNVTITADDIKGANTAEGMRAAFAKFQVELDAEVLTNTLKKELAAFTSIFQTSLTAIVDLQSALELLRSLEKQRLGYYTLIGTHRSEIESHYNDCLSALYKIAKVHLSKRELVEFVFAALGPNSERRFKPEPDDILARDMLSTVLSEESWNEAFKLEELIFERWEILKDLPPNCDSMDECLVNLLIAKPDQFSEKLSRFAKIQEIFSPKQKGRLWREFVVPHLKQVAFDPQVVNFALKSIFKGQSDMQWSRVNEVANFYFLNPAQIEELENTVFSKNEQASAYVSSLSIQKALKQAAAKMTAEEQIEFLRWLQDKVEIAPKAAVDLERVIVKQTRGGIFLREEILELPIGARAAILLEFVTPYSETSLMSPKHPDREELVFDLLLEDVEIEQRSLAKTLLKAYTHSSNLHGGTGYQFAAEMLAASLDQGPAQSSAEQLKSMLETRGSLWIKIGQMLGADPQLISDDKVREIFQVLNERAAEPRRKEIYELLAEALGPTEMMKIKSVRQILGSGSINVTVLIELYDGRFYVARLLKNDAGNSAAFERDVLLTMAAKLRGENADHPRIGAILQIADALEEYGSVLTEKMRSESDLNNDRQAYALLHHPTEPSYDGYYPALNTKAELLAEAADSGIVYRASPDDFTGADSKRVLFYEVLPDIKEELRLTDPEAYARFQKTAWLAEWEALYLHGRFDPDGHLGNWRVARDPKDPARLILWRIDYSQAEMLSPTLLRSLQNSLAYLFRAQNPGLVTAAKPSHESFAQNFISLLAPIEKDATLDKERIMAILALELKVLKPSKNTDTNPIRLLAELKGRLNAQLGAHEKIRFILPIQMAVKAMFLSQQLLNTSDPANKGFVGDNFLRLVLRQPAWRRYFTGANYWILNGTK